MIQPGLVSVTFRHLSPHEVINLTAASGLDAIEWGGDFHVPTPAIALETRQMGLDQGIGVVAFGSYWHAEGDFGPILETAVTLGAPTIRVWAGKNGSLEESQRSTIADNLRTACVEASTAGLTVSLEFHSHTLTDTLQSTLELVEEVDHPALRLYWQPVPTRSHGERLSELRELLPLLTNLHVFQWTQPEKEIIRHPLVEGEKEWPDYLLAAPGDRFALLEFVPGNDPTVLAREAATLRGWL